METDVKFLDGAKELINLVFKNKHSYSDITEAWKTLKDCLKRWAKCRTRSIRSLHNAERKVLMNQYHIVMTSFQDGEVSQEAVREWRRRFEEFLKRDLEKLADENKIRALKDHHFDIQKDQKRLKLAGESRIERLCIEGEFHEGTEEIVDGVHKAMIEELSSFGGPKDEAGVSEEERYFLDFVEELTLSDDEIYDLTKPIEGDEIEIIFDKVDPDSSPGEDGITYRMLKCFWQLESFQKLYLEFCNFVKDNGSFGHVKNQGIMILRNKLDLAFNNVKPKEKSFVFD